ncbi:MAG TPA: PaaI family thioesterase [Thermoplasmata archaeon]|nr:PaaI family thioesterase [Thermoplasmata archaeon]
MVAVQDRYAPNSTCFGCGPANPGGLHIKSDADGDGLVSLFDPLPHHQAFEGYISGGILSVLLDCHCNWTGTIALMKSRGLEKPPPTVTAELSVKMRKPTPLASLVVKAKPVEVKEDRVWVEGEVFCGDLLTASGRGLFVAVKEGHPAFNRW